MIQIYLYMAMILMFYVKIIRIWLIFNIQEWLHCNKLSFYDVYVCKTHYMMFPTRNKWVEVIDLNIKAEELDKVYHTFQCNGIIILNWHTPRSRGLIIWHQYNWRPSLSNSKDFVQGADLRLGSLSLFSLTRMITTLPHLLWESQKVLENVFMIFTLFLSSQLTLLP